MRIKRDYNGHYARFILSHLLWDGFLYFYYFIYVKDNMTKINVVKFHKGYPPRNRSMSRDLSVLADKVVDVYETDLKGKYKKV